MKDLQKIKEFFSKSLEENQPQFKKGDKVTYLGHPAEITAVNKEMTGDITYSVAYNKGYGRTKASNIHPKSGAIKPLKEAKTGVDMAKKRLDQLGVKYEMSKTDKVRPFKVIYKPINKSDKFYDEFEDIVDLFNLKGFVKTSMNESKEESLYKNWDQFEKPSKIKVYLNNGKTLEITPLKLKGGKRVYDAILQAFIDDRFDITNKVIQGMTNNLSEAKEEDIIDTITMDIPLFLRMLEYSREDAKKDLDLHDVTEKANKLGKERGILSMDDYEEIVGAAEEIDEAVNLKASKLSSAEYQKAKKLKDFKSSDWKWNADEDLYTKVNEAELNEAKSFTIDSESASDSDKITDFLTSNNIKFTKIGSKIKILLDRDTPKALVILSKLRSLSKFDELNEAELSEAYVPSNIKEFAKRKGVSSLVNKVAGWAEKVGKGIRGGTAIGYNYSTLILDMTYQGSEIRINTDDDTVTLYDEPVRSFNDFQRVYADGEGNNLEEGMGGEIDEKYFVKVSSKDARKAIGTYDEYRDNFDIKKYDDTLYASNTPSDIYDFYYDLSSQDIEIEDWNIGEDEDDENAFDSEYEKTLKETIKFIKENNPKATSEEVISELKEIKRLGEQLNEELCEKGKRYIKARQAAGEKSSAYLSGRGVKVCKGSIEWPKKGKKK